MHQRRGRVGMADNLRVTAVESEEPAYAQVIALGDANSSTLGHLPYAVYEEAAESGCLLAAVHGDEVIGYALFALEITASRDIADTSLRSRQRSWRQQRPPVD